MGARSHLLAWLVGTSAGLALGVLPAPAGAHDHGPSASGAPSGLEVRASLTPELGRYGNLAARGDFQGLALRAELDTPWVSAWVGVSAYRVFRVIDARVGTSDLTFGVASALRLGDALTLVPQLSVGVPTGDDDLQLGMGHVMLMPGLGARLALGAWSLGARVSYCHGLDTDGHVHLPPLVAPMFLREIEGGLSARVVVGARVGLWADLAAARSLLDDQARLTPRLGADVALGPLTLGLWAALPGPGLPYDWRVGATLAFVVALP